MSEQSQQGLVIIGNKPLMNYVVACLSLFNSGATEVKIRARGQAICSAVETTNLLKKAFVKDLVIRDISIGTQNFSSTEGRNTRVSTMDIVVSK
jgi:archaea-specific DNA-binding protein